MKFSKQEQAFDIEALINKMQRLIERTLYPSRSDGRDNYGSADDVVEALAPRLTGSAGARQIQHGRTDC